MTEIKTVVIVDPRYLVQSGLEKMLMELPRLMLAKTFTGDEPNLTGHIVKQEADILILNPQALKEDMLSVLSRLKKSCDLVIFGLLDKNAPKNIQSHFSHVLYISDSKFELQAKIRSALNIVTKNEQQSLLSDREITILKQVVLGLTNQEIADKLFLSVHTVMTHRKNINRKLDIKTVSGLTVYAIMNHMVSMEEVGHTLK